MQNNFGTTFSQLQCKYLQLDYKEALSEILKLPLKTIRVCAYWNEIEEQKSEYNFTKLDYILEQTTQKNKNIILAVGMKAPRWPEFHIPAWIENSDTETKQNACSEYTRLVLRRYSTNSNITHIQIENEPLNAMHITNNRSIETDFLLNQIWTAKSIKQQHQKIMTTAAINLFPYSLGTAYNRAFATCLNILDSVGVNVYTKIGIPFNIYVGPFFPFWWKLRKWRDAAYENGVEPWITELQSEPWEDGGAVHTSRYEFPSASPQQTEQNVKKLLACGYKNILFWGCEYWFWQKKSGRDSWWNKIEKIISQYS